jgi:hypothetical protein
VLILGSSDAASLAEALEHRGFAGVPVAEDGASAALAANGYQAIILAPAPKRPTAQVVAELLKSGQAGGAPVIVSLGVRDTAQRDQCLIAGAYDVSLDGQPDDIAGRVDAAVNGWLRATPRRQLKATFRAQRGRQFIDLKVSDIDPTGFAIAPVEGIAEGALLRVSVALPDGELLAWGRLSSADGEPGVRLIALVPDERLRIVNAIRGRTAPTGSGAAVAAPAEITAPPVPAMVAAPVDLLAPPHEEVTDPPVLEAIPSAKEAPVSPPVPPVPPVAREATVPPARREATVPPRAREATVPPIAREATQPPSSREATAPPAARSTVPEASREVTAPPPARETTSPPPAATSLSGAEREAAIAEAIGSFLEEPREETAAPDTAVDEPDAGAETILWPGALPDVEVCAAMLREAASLAMVGEYENGPPSHVVLAFARSLSPIEKRAFDAVPPPELPEAGLAIRCLVHRLRLFALIDDAVSVPTDGSATVLIDDDALAALAAEVNRASTELQKVIDGFVATAQTQRFKEISTFRNALSKAQSDLKAAVARLRGEVMARGNMALLDVHESVPGGAPAPVVRRTEPTPQVEKKPEKKAEFNAGIETTPQQRERRRIAGWLTLMVLLIIGGVTIRVLRPPPRELTSAELAELMDVKQVILAPRKHHAFVIVSMSWKADQAHRASLEAMTRRHSIDTFTVQNIHGEAVAAKLRTSLTQRLDRRTAAPRRHAG